MLKKLNSILFLAALLSAPYSFLKGMESQESESQEGYAEEETNPLLFPFKKSKKIESLMERCGRCVLNKLILELPEEIDQQLVPSIVDGDINTGVPQETREMLVNLVNNPQDRAGNRLFHNANSALRVKQLLKLGANYNCRNISEETPLIALLKKFKTYAVIALLENAPKDLDVNCQDCFKTKPLDLASRITNNSTIKRLLLERGAAQTWSEKLGGLGSFSTIFRQGNDDTEEHKVEGLIRFYMAQFLLQDSVNYFYSLDEDDQAKIKQALDMPLSPFGITRFHLAETELDVQKLLLVEANYKKRTKNNENCLHYMIKSGHRQAALKLLGHLSGDEAKDECNVVDCYHMTPLCSAVFLGDTKLVKALVAKGANVDYMYEDKEKDNFVNIFHLMAFHKENREMMELLFSKSTVRFRKNVIMALMASAIEQDNAYMLYKLLPKGFSFDTYLHKNYNLLMHAIVMNRFECAEKIITGKAMIYDENTRQGVPVLMNCVQPNNNGVTPLLLAAACGTPDFVKLFLDNGAKTSDSTQKGLTVLMTATGNIKNPSVITLLLEYGASLTDGIGKEFTNNHGETALHVAARYGNLEAVKLLVAAGADIFAQDNHGNTPDVLAKKKEYLMVVDYLNSIKKLKR